MPALKTVRYDNFARGVARGMSLTGAAKEYGHGKPGGSDHDYAKTDEFKERVEEIKPTLPWSGTRDVRPVIDELSKAALLAMNKAEAEMSAPWLKAAGELFRIIADLKQRLPIDAEPDPGPRPAPPMTPEEWVRRFGPEA